jgi:predicted metal-dependent peptidase
MTNPNFQRELSTTKMKVIRYKSLGFFASLMFNLKIMPDEKVEEIQTNGIDIMINPDWFLRQGKEERVYILMHATMHIALQHPSRMRGRDKKLWQAASDYVVNQSLRDYNITLPQGALIDNRFRGKTTEKVYEELLEKQKDGDEPPPPDYDDLQPPPVGGQGQSKPKDGEGEEGEGNGPPKSQFDSQEDFDNKMEDLMNQAKVQAKMSDNYDPNGLPEEMQRLLQDLEKPMLPWDTILSRFLNEVAKANYNFLKPNRRFFPEYYLPSMHSEGLSRVDFIIDTSGSIGNREFTQFVSEVDKVLKKYKPEKIGVSQFDHEYRGTEIVTSTTDVRKLKVRGGGGTRIEETLAAVGEMQTKCLIIFTDGYMNLNLVDPKKPVVWAIYNNDNFVAPFGKAIHFKLKD